jgi:selT/selW/selH-like putative selenoprotein
VCTANFRLQSYARKYADLVRRVKQMYPGDDISVTGEATPKRTGWFEVTVNGSLVFSARKGMGNLNSEQKWQRLMKAIQSALPQKNQGNDDGAVSLIS